LSVDSTLIILILFVSEQDAVDDGFPVRDQAFRREALEFLIKRGLQQSGKESRAKRMKEMRLGLFETD